MKRVWKQEFKVVGNFKCKLDGRVIDCIIENFSSIYSSIENKVHFSSLEKL